MHDHKPCPVCGGRDRFYLITAPHNGGAPYWRCRVCDYCEPDDDSSAEDAPEAAPRQVYDPDTIAAIYRAYAVIAERCAAALWRPEGRQALAYLRGRGLHDTTIRDLNLGWTGDGAEVLTEVWRAESGRFDVARGHYERASVYDMCLLGGLRRSGSTPRQVLKYAITIPYYHNLPALPAAVPAGRQGGACVLLRSRKLRPRAGEPKYLSPSGPMYATGTPRLYLADDMAGADGVIVTEGEIKAMVARQEWRAGRSYFPCVATPGASYWPEAFTEALRGKVVYLAFDNDANETGQAAQRKIAEKLRMAGLAVKMITLPRRAGDAKIDLDRYVLEARYAAS